MTDNPLETPGPGPDGITPQIPIYVISLARAVARRREITAHLNQLGLRFELVDAVDGARIPAEERRAMQVPGRDLRPGNLGCYLSHIEVYRRMEAGQAPVALVLEDDALLDPRIVPLLRRGVPRLDCDYCLLDCHPANPQGHVYYDRRDGVTLGAGFTAFTVHAAPTGTHAYLVTREAAALRRRHAFPIQQVLDLYRGLPAPPRFRVLVSPPGAGVSPESLRSLSDDRVLASGAAMALLRALPGYYAFRRLTSPKLWRLRARVPDMMRGGILPKEGSWQPLPPGRRVLR
ncbi:glycosyltransferase family 25 protein [Falsiroseomonas sp.]|uniref:glycosyltransferase family 25 protein n=1 Tax=Falsiroseomonas sp. TaxID=2870721 RepID=UPI003F7154A9